MTCAHDIDEFPTARGNGRDVAPFKHSITLTFLEFAKSDTFTRGMIDPKNRDAIPRTNVVIGGTFTVVGTLTVTLIKFVTDILNRLIIAGDHSALARSKVRSALGQQIVKPAKHASDLHAYEIPSGTLFVENS